MTGGALYVAAGLFWGGLRIGMVIGKNEPEWVEIWNYHWIARVLLALLFGSAILIWPLDAGPVFFRYIKLKRKSASR